MKQVLVVDDSSTMRQLMKMVLSKSLSCQIIEAADGLEALVKLKQGGIDLVVTDLNMPRLDGIGLVRMVRQELKLTVPIVIVTTKGAEADRDKGLELGANAYLTKPINGAQVITTVCKLLG